MKKEHRGKGSGKARKSNGRIMTVIASILLVLVIVANAVCMYLSRILDVYVGQGEEIVTTIEGSEDWDTEYYTSDYSTAEEADAAAKEVTQTISEESIVLLKNDNNTLPLPTDNGSTKTSLFGRRSVDTVYGGSSALLQEVLRGEWGFLGTVTTDYNNNEYQHVEEGVANGNDLMLANSATLPTRFADTSNASTLKIMRQAMKNILYTLVNSNTVNGKSASTYITYGIAPWRVALYIADAVLGVIIVLLYVLAFLKRKKSLAVKVEIAEEEPGPVSEVQAPENDTPQA